MSTIATRYSGYFEIIEKGQVIGYFPISALAVCEDRKWTDTLENRALLRPATPQYRNVTYTSVPCTKIEIQVPKATRCTALLLNRADGYLSLLAKGSGILSYRVIGVNGTPSPATIEKVFETVPEGYNVPAQLGTGTAPYGGFQGNIQDGTYKIEIIDEAGGVDTYPAVNLTATSPRVVLKGTFDGSTAPVDPTDPTDPTNPPSTTIPGISGWALQGKRIISPSRRPDLMDLNVIVGQDDKGIWRYIIRDVATGNFPNKRYRAVDGKTWITKDQLHALNPYLWFPNVVVASEDEDPRDNKAHATQKITGF